MDSKKQHIIQHALHIFIDKGIEHASVQDILEEANISRGTFYKFFASKDECVADIISQIHMKIREELELKLIGQSIHDKHVLQEQLVLYLERVNKYHLYDLVRVIRQGHNKELRQMVFNEEIANIRWMSQRINDVFGDEIRSCSFEAMTLYYGVLQTVMIKHKVDQQPINYEKTIAITMRYLEQILQEMQRSQQFLFEYEVRADSTKKDKESLLQELEKAANDLAEEDRHLIEAIKEELTREMPRKTVLRALSRSLNDSLENVTAAVEAFIL